MSAPAPHAPGHHRWWAPAIAPAAEVVRVDATHRAYARVWLWTVPLGLTPAAAPDPADGRAAAPDTGWRADATLRRLAVDAARGRLDPGLLGDYLDDLGYARLAAAVRVVPFHAGRRWEVWRW